MTQGNLINQTWEIGRSSAQCGSCLATLAPGTACWATLVEMDAASAEKSTSRGPLGRFARRDFCEACWQSGRRPEAPAVMFSYWKTMIPETEQKRKLFVDDGVLLDVFNRLESRTAPADIQFRFVLALLLMRKRLIKYEGTEAPAGTDGSTDGIAVEIWRMVLRNSGHLVLVTNPHLTAQQIGEVSQQLSSILAEEV